MKNLTPLGKQEVLMCLMETLARLKQEHTILKENYFPNKELLNGLSKRINRIERIIKGF
jgi:hypothetical protein